MPPTTLSVVKSLVKPIALNDDTINTTNNRYPISTLIVFIHSISALECIYSKKSNQEIPLRKLKVSDHTFDNANINVVLWRERATNIENLQVGDVVLVQNAHARFNPFKNEMEISISGGYASGVFRTIVSREEFYGNKTIEEMSERVVPLHRKLGTTDDKATRDAILTVCAWVYGEKMSFLYHLKERMDLGASFRPPRVSSKRRAGEKEEEEEEEEEKEEFEMHHQQQRTSFVKRFKRTLLEEYVGVILDVSFVKSSFGDAFNGKYVRPVLTLSRRPVDRQRNEQLLQRRLTLSKPTESPQVLNNLACFGNMLIGDQSPALGKRPGDDLNNTNFIEATLSAAPKREAKDLAESVYKIGRCVELRDFAIAEVLNGNERKTNRSCVQNNKEDNFGSSEEIVKKLVLVDTISTVRVLDPNKDPRARKVMTVVGKTHRRLSFEVENVSEIFQDINERTFQEFTDNYDEEDERVYGREVVEEKRRECVKAAMEKKHKEMLLSKTRKRVAAMMMTETQNTTHSIAEMFESVNNNNANVINRPVLYEDGTTNKRRLLPPFVEFKAVVKYVEIEHDVTNSRSSPSSSSAECQRKQRKQSITNSAKKSILSADGVMRVPGLKNGTKSVSEIASELVQVACATCENRLHKDKEDVYEYCKHCPAGKLSSANVNKSRTKCVFKPLVLGLEDAKGDCIRGKIPPSLVSDLVFFQKPEDISDGNTGVTRRNRSETIAIGALRALMAGKRNSPFTFTAKMPKSDENGWVVRGDEIEIVRFDSCLTPSNSLEEEETEEEETE
ncbi:unnamed protein product [Bathycoccus prasinos]